ncbi:MAG TPA: Ig-like domain-containing protein [Longimicrobium sp.]|jgi:uncharacterized protein YjdB|uniref:Ig-like domain-containing protein n=1 Tax=Longimicrobium sp. TaxID=2029185 RepID=UPI002EDA5582
MTIQLNTRLSSFRRRGAVLLLLAAAACGDNPAGGGEGQKPPVPTPVASVALDPEGMTLEIGNLRAIGARTLAADGTELAGRAVSWSSSDPAVAEVSAAGQVTARAAGVAMIRATAEGRYAETRVEVPERVARVEIAPGTLALRVGENGVLAAYAYGPGGAPVTGLPVQWSSTNPAVATVAADGRVSAVSVGQAAIRATVLGRIAEVPVQVSAAPPVVARVLVTPAQLQLKVGEAWSFTAQPYSAAGQPVDAPAPVWTSSNPSVATVGADGRVRAVALGAATIRATIAGVTGEGVVSVAADPPPPPDPVVYDLALVDGQALPAALYTRDMPGGQTGTVRMQGGYLQADAIPATGTAHYEIALYSATFMPDGSLRDSEAYFDEGTAERSADGIILRSTMHAGHTFTARSGGAGTVIVRQALGGTGTVRDFTFRAQ